MRTQELIAALAKGPGGLQINITNTKVTVSIMDITCKGLTIFDAAFQVAQRIIDRDFPEEVVAALKEYDVHTEILSI